MATLSQVLMMIDIFSSFDPATSSIFHFSPILFWATNIITILIISPILWTSKSNLFWLVSYPIDLIYLQSLRTNTTNIKGLSTILVALFIFIISINFIGILPYVFRRSSHLVFTFALGLPLWLRIIISSITFSPYSTAALLLPRGAPSWLNPFLILIETVRTLVRPITLSVRLAANMSAGHIVLTLLRVYLVYTFIRRIIVASILILFIQIGYTLFEIGICLIQAYIFCLLLSLYSEDHAPTRI